MTDGYDFDIAQVGDRIFYSEDSIQDLEATGELIYLYKDEKYIKIGIDDDDSPFDLYWVIPEDRTFDYTVELLEWNDA